MRSPPPEGLTWAEEKSSERRDAAARRLQRYFKSKKLQRMWDQTIENLQKQFLDPRAVAAGATDNKWYSNTALAVRNALKQASEVEEGLLYAWNAIAEAVGTCDGLNYDMYTVMCRKLYLAVRVRPLRQNQHVAWTRVHIRCWPPRATAAPLCACAPNPSRVRARLALPPSHHPATTPHLSASQSKLEEGESSIDVSECMENMREDWKEDTDGRPLLSEDLFNRCWFQLADVNTETVDANEYAKWITDTVDVITKLDEGE